MQVPTRVSVFSTTDVSDMTVLFYCRVHVCTWNVKVTQPPDEDFRAFLHLDNDQELPDIVAVGLVVHLSTLNSIKAVHVMF